MTPARSRGLAFPLVLAATAAATAALVVMLPAALRDASTDTARAAVVSPYLDMRTPLASVRSYALALHDRRWHDACAHHLRVARTHQFLPCVSQMRTLTTLAPTLRVVLGVVSVYGPQAREADIPFRSTIGFPNGIATLELREAQWLITGFLPQRG